MWTSKSDLREHIKSLRRSADPAQLASASLLASSKLEAFIKHRLTIGAGTKPIVVSGYSALSGEVNINNALDALIRMGVQVALPRTEGRQMMFHQIQSLKGLEPSSLRFLEPPKQNPFVEKIDLMIIPGLAFSRRFERLGFGKGHFDYFIEAYRKRHQSEPVKVGVAFNFQLFDQIPTDPWDSPLDAIVTESEVLERKI